MLKELEANHERQQRKTVSYDIGCMKSLRSFRPSNSQDYGYDDALHGRPFGEWAESETVEGARDNSIKSLRVDQGYRAIAFEVGRDIMFVHVNEHEAYRWASGRRVKLDPAR